ncbi:TRAP transporter large permease [Oceanicola sp. 502str15]|uniref:TRAP transporter large permease n=1 Tax=Oceanicola sp. 502str15 TaxID=2696061 RepID=UPI002095A63B|nr:TRAP transporter large permease [Oceanicola sp. 502str15]MCO6383312.1 TRAP transporter large permease subunit [Oceanicola sp. 502str15]
MAFAALLITFAFFMAMGAPVALAMGIASMVYILLGDVMPSIFIFSMVESLGGVTLLAIPFFVLAGEIMNVGGVTERIFRFAGLLVGHIRGGLAHVNILSSLFFAGISGSAVADTAGLGRIEIKAMTKAGYSAPFSAAVTAASSCIGPIIPPSILMVLYGSMTEVSIPALFIGGLVPGLLLGLFMMVYVYFAAKREGVEPAPRATLCEIGGSFIRNAPPLATPFVILAGLVFGIVTPTEAGVIAVAYACVVSMAYGDMKWRNMGKMLEEALVTTTQIMFILGMSSLFGWLVTTEQLPDAMAEFFDRSGYGQIAFLFAMNIILLLLGTIMSLTSILVIFTPTLVGMGVALGVDPVHLGVVIVLNLTVGLITPPLGWCLYIVTEIAEIRFIDTARAILPFLIPILLVLLIITYVPAFVTYPGELLLPGR